MTDNPNLKRSILLLRWTRVFLLMAIATLVSISFTGNVSAQTGDAGLGVGKGQGTEVGINVTALNALKADINKGTYDRPCTAAEHNTTKWHTLVNIQAKCHYDHIHGDDPNYVNDLFGEPGAWFGKAGQSVSYPWQTFKAATALEPNDAYVAAKQMENDIKHEGYVWVVRRDQPCAQGKCVTDFRLQTHAIFGAHDMPVRYHSYSLEARLCNVANDPSSCGIIRYAGWVDMGRLFTTAPGVVSCTHDVAPIFISLPADTLYFPIDRPASRDEVRCHPNITNLPAYPSQRPLAEWWGHAGGETRFQLRVYDPIGNVDPANPANWKFFCGQNDLNCRYDASIMSAFIGYVLHIHTFVGPNNARVDANGDGRTDYKGYFNRWGGPRTGCTAASLDCIPYEYNNVVLNFFNNTEARYFHTPCENCARIDMDISPPGQKWITWFYRYASGNHGTATPAPVTPTPVPATKTTTPVAPTKTLTPVAPTVTTVPPTTTPPPNPTGATVRVELSKTTGVPGDKLEVALKLYNVTNLYGMQAQCTVNPAVLTGTTMLNGEAFINETNSFFVDNRYQTNGSWLTAAARKQPSMPVSGTTIAYKLGYTVAGAGSSPVTCTILAVDPNGREIKLAVQNGSFNGGTTPPATTTPMQPATNTPTVVPPTATPVTPTVMPATATLALTSTPPPGTAGPTPTLPPTSASLISGTFQYQNRPDNAGVKVELFSNGTAVVSLTTNANGAYQFTDVPAGNYVIEATAANHLKVTKAITVAQGGQPITVAAILLPAGDTDGNGTIDVVDASLIGGNFGISAPPAPTAADLNVDKMVDIRDLVLVGGNYGKVGPVTAP